jgi:hypothetical protein
MPCVGALTEQLATLLGEAPARAPMEVLACARPPQLDGLIPVGDGVELLRRRPDVRQAERRVAVATLALAPRRRISIRTSASPDSSGSQRDVSGSNHE